MTSSGPLPPRPKTDRLDGVGLALALAAGALAVLLFVTGAAATATEPDALLPYALGWVARLMSQGPLVLGHLAGSVVLVACLVAYLIRLGMTGAVLRLWPDRSAQVRLRAGSLGTGDALRFSRWLGIVLLATLGASGLLLYADGWSWPKQHVLALGHGIAGYALLAWGLGHSLAAHRLGAGWPRLPRRGLGARTVALIAPILAGVGVAALILILDRSLHRTLQVPALSVRPVLVGSTVGDDVWQQPPPLTLMAGNGGGFAGGQTRVTLKAFHDTHYLYLLLRWDDPERSLKQTPLVKRGGQWWIRRRAASSNALAKGDDYAADHLALLLASTPSLVLGQRLRQRLARPGDENASWWQNAPQLSSLELAPVEELHWDAVRTNDTAGTLVPSPLDTDRQRHASANWTATAPDSDGPVQPVCLPTTPSDIAPLQQVDWHMSAIDQGRWYVRADDCQPFDPTHDAYPDGTVLPSVLLHPVTDAEKTRARGHWADGTWTLELERPLDAPASGLPPLTPGTTLYVWLALFEHENTPPATLLRPIALVIE